MKTLSPTHLISAANAFVGFGEDHPGRSRGRLVHRFLTQVGVPGGAIENASWDVAFVHHVGYWSHYDHRSARSAWPLPISVDANILARFAKREGVLESKPVAGDLFLLMGPDREKYTRAGIVTGVEDVGYYRNQRAYYECVTIEGDTNRVRDMRGGLLLRHLRVLSAERGDRFVRWTALAAGAQGHSVVDLSARQRARTRRGPEVIRLYEQEEAA